MIPAEAVEVAAKAILAAGNYAGRWEDLPVFMQNQFTRDARAALEAAAPYIPTTIDDALWAEFQAATVTAGTNPSETIRQLVREWVNTNKQGGQMSIPNEAVEAAKRVAFERYGSKPDGAHIR